MASFQQGGGGSEALQSDVPPSNWLDPYAWGAWLRGDFHADHKVYPNHARRHGWEIERFHPFRRLWRELLTNRLSPTSCVLLIILLVATFLATRLFIRLCYRLGDRLSKKCRRRTTPGVPLAPFHKKRFWEREYKKKPDEFEWYAEYKHVRPLLLAHAGPRSRVLHVGCGTSAVGKRLYEDGIHSIVNIDISARALRLAEKQSRDCPDMEFVQADARDLTPAFPKGSCFELAVEKGTLDSLVCDEANGEANALALLSELARILVPGGVLLLVTTCRVSEVEHLLQRLGSARRFALISRTRLVTKSTRRRVKVLPADAWLLRREGMMAAVRHAHSA